VSDPADFSKVKLLLLGNGSNGSTTITDSSLSARTVTANGGAQISTAWSKFGGASIALDGNGDYLTVPDDADFDLGSGDWTIEFWYRRAAGSSANRGLIGKRNAASPYNGTFWFTLDSSSYVNFFCRTAGGVTHQIAADIQTLAGTDCHVAAVREGNTVRFYINGNSEFTVTPTLSGAMFVSTGELCIGNTVAALAGTTSAATCLSGNVDDLRITKGEALYTGEIFTPPTVELPVGLTDVQARVAAAGPLGEALVVGHSGMLGRLLAAGPLGAVQGTAYVQPVSLMSAPGPLGGARVLAEHDFTAILEAVGATEFYTCDLIDGEVSLQVPVSSWQGTLQLEGANYLQAVIPAVADLAPTINALGAEAEFVIYRCARLPDGFVVRQEMGRSLVEQVQLDQGPGRFTCTISGYSDSIAEPVEGVGPPVRILRGVRSISSGTGGARARCAIDWFLRPGGAALAGSLPLTADYINFYAGGRDAYADVGERA
jgi:hypothetical protein